MSLFHCPLPQLGNFGGLLNSVLAVIQPGPGSHLAKLGGVGGTSCLGLGDL